MNAVVLIFLAHLWHASLDFFYTKHIILFYLAVSHFQLPVTANSDPPPDLYLCLHQSDGSQPARQEQDRV